MSHPIYIGRTTHLYYTCIYIVYNGDPLITAREKFISYKLWLTEDAEIDVVSVHATG